MTLSPGPRAAAGDDRGGREDLLEVVEDQQQPLVAQPVGQRLAIGRAPALATPRALAIAARRARDRGWARAARRRRRPGSRRRPGGELQREARLAGPARAGERQQPGRASSRPPPRARRRVRRTSSAASAGCSGGRPGSEGREVARQPGGDELQDALRRAQVLEPVLAEVAQRRRRRRVVDELVADQAGRQDLPAVRDVRDAAPRG